MKAFLQVSLNLLLSCA